MSVTVQICTDLLVKTFRKSESSYQLLLAQRKFCHHQMIFCIKSVLGQVDYLSICVSLSIPFKVRGPCADEATFTLHYF